MLKLKNMEGLHTISDIDIYIGNGILDNTPGYILKRDFGRSCLMIADKNTYSAAGKVLYESLLANGFKVQICTLDRCAGRIEADELSAGDVLVAFDPEPDFLIACGSGVINDITRFVAHSTNKPFVSVGTAASMDGYISVIAPMIYHGKKVHRHGSAPKVLVLDTEILRKSPYEMVMAGFGDVFGKYIAKADWLLSDIVNGEKVDNDAVGLINRALDNIINNMEEIKKLTNKGLEAIIEALILAGITIFTTGQTRAVASIEHNQGHIWETRMIEYGKPYALHGISVGCSTGYYLRMYDYFKAINVKTLNRDAARKAILDYEEIKASALKCFGEEFLSVVLPQNPAFTISGEEFERQYDAITCNWDGIVEVLGFLPDWNKYRKIYRDLNCTIFAEDIGIPAELLDYTLGYSNYYRNRYSVVDAMNILGVSKRVSSKVLADYRNLKYNKQENREVKA
jgi:Glycerol dehydrogenase and related enzymes